MSATECAARHNEEIHQTAPMQHRDQAKITYRSAWTWMREWDTGIETTVPGYVSTDSASEHAWAAGRGRERHLVVPRATPHCPLEVQLVLVIQRSNRWRDRVRQLISSLEVQPVPYARRRWAAAALLASGSGPESGERHKCSRGKLSKRPLSLGISCRNGPELLITVWRTWPTRLLNQRWPVLLLPQPLDGRPAWRLLDHFRMGHCWTPSLPGLAKWRCCCCLLAPTWPGHLPGFSHGGRGARSLAGSQEGGRPSPAGWWLSGGLRTRAFTRLV